MRTSYSNWLRTLLGFIAMMTALALGWVFLRQPNRVPAGSTDAAASNSSRSTEKSPGPQSLDASRGSPRQPAVLLPSVALPATPEKLQQESDAVASELLARYPNVPEALHVAAMLRSQMRQSSEAENLWRRCIELDSRQPAYYVNLAALAMDRGNSDMAVETLRNAVDAGCSSPDIDHHLAVSLTNLGKCDEAEQVALKALAANPQSSALWLVLGQAQLKTGKAADAEVSLRKALAFGNRSAEIYFALASACARQGKDAEAESNRKLFADLKAAQPLPVQQRFQILTAAESRRTAVAILTEAASVHSLQGNSLEAERLLLRAIALDPSSIASCRTLANLYHASGMIAEERVVRRRLIETEPQNFDNYLNLAKASAQVGESEAAEATLKLAMSVLPEANVVYATLAQFYLQQGKPKLARWYAQEFVRREPTAEGYAFLASTCRQLGNDADAEAALSMARKLESNKK